MPTKNELLQQIRRAKSAVEDIESKTDDIEDDPEGTADEIRSMASDASAILKRLGKLIEQLEL